MQCAVVTETYPPEVNGVALTVASMVDGLRRRGHAVHVVRPRQRHEDLCDDAHALTVGGMRLPRHPGLQSGVPSGRLLARRWTASRPDVVYVATEGLLGWSALRTARKLGIPAATGFHTRFDLYMRSYGARWLEAPVREWLRHVHGMGDATFVATEELASLLRAQGFRQVERLQRSVDTGLFTPAARDVALRRIWGVEPGGTVVMYFGRLAPEKNVWLAARAFQALRAEWSGPSTLRMVWVGEGPIRGELEAAHPDHVFTGLQTGAALARHVASADLFLFPSTSETFGNVVLEALACAVPTVAFDRAAAREHLVDGVHGACVTDEAAFVEATLRLGLDARLRQAMRDAAFATRWAYAPDATARAYEDTLSRLAARTTLEHFESARMLP